MGNQPAAAVPVERLAVLFATMKFRQALEPLEEIQIPVAVYQAGLLKLSSPLKRIADQVAEMVYKKYSVTLDHNDLSTALYTAGKKSKKIVIKE